DGAPDAREVDLGPVDPRTPRPLGRVGVGDHGADARAEAGEGRGEPAGEPASSPTRAPGREGPLPEVADGVAFRTDRSATGALHGHVSIKAEVEWNATALTRPPRGAVRLGLRHSGLRFRKGLPDSRSRRAPRQARGEAPWAADRGGPAGASGNRRWERPGGGKQHVVAWRVEAEYDRRPVALSRSRRRTRRCT